MLSLLEIYALCLKAGSVPGSQPVQNDSSSFSQNIQSETCQKFVGWRQKSHNFPSNAETNIKPNINGAV